MGDMTTSHRSTNRAKEAAHILSDIKGNPVTLQTGVVTVLNYTPPHCHHWSRSWVPPDVVEMLRRSHKLSEATVQIQFRIKRQGGETENLGVLPATKLSAAAA